MLNHFSNRKLSPIARIVVTVIILLVIASLPVLTAFAADSGYSSPSTASTTGKGWKNMSYAFVSDNSYAVGQKANKAMRLGKFTIPGIPGGSVINGVEVKVEGYTAGLQANVALSSNAGSSYTAPLLTALPATDTVTLLGGPTNTWGRTWTAGDFTNNNFMVKLTATGATGNGKAIYVDQVQVKVYYTAPNSTLVLAAVSGPYNGTASMSATLTATSGGAPILGKNINFYVGGTGLDSNGNCTGTLVGNVATQSPAGTATLPNASLASINNAGDYPYGACASFAGDGTYAATSITSDLNVVGTGTTLTPAAASGIYGNTTSLSATLTYTSGGAPISNQFIDFYLFGNLVGTGKTDGTGLATVSNIPLTDYDAGVSNDFVVSFAGNANLNPATGSGQITINPRPITVTAVSDNRIYNGTTSSTGVPTITSGSLVTGDTTYFTQTYDTKDAGTGKTMIPAGYVDDGNSGLDYSYTWNTVSTGTITPTLLTVTADNQNKLTGEADPTFTYQYSGFVNGETGSIIETPPTCVVSTAHTAAGTYPITCSGAVDAQNDYTFSYTPGTLTVGIMNVYVPMLFKNAFGGTYNAALYIQNVGGSGANITMKYYDSNGILSCTQTDAIPSLASRGYWVPSVTCNTGSLPNGWVGGVVVTSDQRIVAVGRPHVGAEVMTYNGFTSGTTSAYVPMLFKSAFDGSYNAALYVQNVNASNPASITLKFYNSNGGLDCTKTDTINQLA
ncbi:MAG: MBG domain-containing protein, partial [Bacteroidota bacterium]